MPSRNRQHILIKRPALAEPFRPHPRRIEPAEWQAPSDRRAHAARLAAELQAAERKGLSRRSKRSFLIEDAVPGIYVTFESFPGLELALERLDSRSGKLHPELVSVQFHQTDGAMVERATVFIPDGTLGLFMGKIDQYLNTVAQDKPRQRELVDRIRSIRLATLMEVWSDPPAEFPAAESLVWWELWLRRRDGREVERLSSFAAAVSARVSQRTLGFADRTVMLIEATATQLSQALDVLDDLAELRRPSRQATLLAADRAVEQADWVDELAERTSSAPGDAPAACILDTGIHQPHPLLASSLDPVDCQACDPAWNTGDHDGHGTEMAGLALYGDLGAAILTSAPVQLRHRLESVKFLPPPPGTNLPELYGAVTAMATSLPEIVAPRRRRVFSIATTATWQLAASQGSTRAFGQPSSWSSAVDALAAGLSIDTTDGGLIYLDEGVESAHRLFLLSTGNVPPDQWAAEHLNRSDLSPIEDPAQAWNAIAVGAYTSLDSLENADSSYAGWTPVAARNELSPFSRTSVAFSRVWPVKPDIVMEGGNVASSPAGTTFDTPDALGILTTKAPLRDRRMLTVTRASSAATAEAAYLAASILSDYPSLWPETVRALIVHSAEWTPVMSRWFDGATTRSARVALQRRYGMGVPDLLRATRSASDALTLVVQDTIHPFDDEGRMREMHLHNLPWPSQVLSDLGPLQVRLRITLSYFIEPNPGARGWTRRYSYASHGLRFDVRRRTESTEDFKKRINQKALAEEERRPRGESDAAEWFFGPDNRVSGSIHTDIWTGSAADLAARGVIGIFPVSGWWKLNKERNHSERGARYALVVSIESPSQDVDIWTPVAQEVGISVEV